MTERLRAMIVDDEPLAVRRLQIALGEMPDVELIGVAWDGGAAVRLIQAQTPDLIFLDVKMPIMNGLEVLSALPASARPAVIFVTAFSRFAVNAFEAAAVDYLLKPVEFARLREAIERARLSRQVRDADEQISELLVLVADLQAADAEQGAAAGQETDLWVAEKNGAKRVPLQSVELLAAEGDYVRIHTAARSHLMRERLTVLAERLSHEDFVRVHRSALVKRSAIQQIIKRRAGGLQLVLQSGRIVSVGRSFERHVRRIKRWPST